MVLSQEDVVHILRLMEESAYENLRLEMNGLKLMVSKQGRFANTGEKLFSLEPDDQASAFEERRSLASSDAAVPLPEVIKEATGQAHKVVEEAFEKGLVPIKAPMLGTFYRFPKPNEPPFVEVGQAVDENTTVCMIEVMKLFSAIHAGTRGRIEKICAEDGELVEYGQVLFWIKPDEAPQ